MGDQIIIHWSNSEFDFIFNEPDVLFSEDMWSLTDELPIFKKIS